MIDRSHSRVFCVDETATREPAMPTHISIALQAVLARALPPREEPAQPVRRRSRRIRRSRRPVACAVD